MAKVTDLRHPNAAHLAIDPLPEPRDQIADIVPEISSPAIGGWSDPVGEQGKPQLRHAVMQDFEYAPASRARPTSREQFIERLKDVVTELESVIADLAAVNADVTSLELMLKKIREILGNAERELYS
jgi:hypothetical protein